MDKVSIIIPSYNAENYIVEAINSILEQTINVFEVFIIDDGSTDNTKKVIETNFNDSRIKYFYKENGGEASARNCGLEKAQGEFIAFLDADDLYAPNKIENQLAILKKNPNIDVVYNDVILVDDNTQEIGLLKSEEIFENQADFYANILYRQVIPASASMMLRKKCIEESNARFPEHFSHAVDYAFILQLAEKYNFYYIPEKLYYYRRHSGNLTNSHLLQVECEKNIIKSLGVEKIKQIVMETSHSDIEKAILLSKILLKINEYEAAFKELCKVKFDTWEYAFIKGVILYRLSNYSEATLAFVESISYEPREESYNNLGCCYVHLGNIDEANQYFRKAIELNQQYNDPIFNMDYLHIDSLKLTEKKLRKKLMNYMY